MRMMLHGVRDGVGEDLRGMRRFLRDMARRGTWAQETATQALKAAIASVLAWIVAAHLLALPMPYLAAWAALVVVRPTVHWSVLTGLRQLVAVGLGVVVAVLAVVVTPGKELALAVGVSVAFLIGYWPRLNDQGLYVPFTALFMIAVDSVEEPFVVVRLLETALGAGIGMAVNLLIEPPARVRAVGTRIRQDGAATAEFLRQIAAWLREESERGDGDTWAGRAKRLDSHAAETRSALDHANDSLRLNPHTTSAQTDALDRFHAGFELNQRVLRATRALTDVLDGPARGAIPDDLALDAEFCGDCATVIEETVDVYEGRLTRILTRHDSDPGDSSSADEALTALERRTHAAGDDGVMVEMQATVLVALRRLLSEAQS